MTNLGTGACRSFVKSVWLGLNASCILRQVFWPFRSMCRKERRCQRTCLFSRVQSSRALLETFLHFAQRYYGRKTTLKLHKNKGTGSYLNCSQTGSVPAPFILWSWHLLHWQWTIGWWFVPCQEAGHLLKMEERTGSQVMARLRKSSAVPFLFLCHLLS